MPYEPPKRLDTKQYSEGDYSSKAGQDSLHDAIEKYDNMRGSDNKRKDSIGSILSQQAEPLPASPYNPKHRNRSTFDLGDGYNYFKQDGTVLPKMDFHSLLADRYRYSNER